MRNALGVVAILLSLWIVAPITASAVDWAADFQCLPDAAPDPCICGPKYVPGKGCKGPPTKFMCPCSDTVSGFVISGKCVNTFNCKAMSTSDSKGAVGDLSKVMGLAKSLLDKLMQGGGGGGGGGGGMDGLGNLYPPCTTNPATGTVSPIPCMNPDGSYNYGTSGTGILGDLNNTNSVSQDLLDALGGTSNIIDETWSPEDPSPTGVSDKIDTSGSGGETGGTQNEDGTKLVPTDPKQLKSGSQGDIVIGEGGVTIIGSTRDGNSQTSSFFGSDARSRLVSQSIVGRLCAARPWEGSFVTAIIPAGFFDGLCRIGGYQVGLIPREQVGGRGQQNTFTAPPDVPMNAPPPDTGAPRVDIWAEPDRVRLGARTYIFWSSQNVQACMVSGPSFQHTTFSGGASTVTITDRTVYTIECLGHDGTQATDTVVVDLAI